MVSAYCIDYCLIYLQILASVCLRVIDATGDVPIEKVLVNIDNPETHQSQYHTADFGHSKY